MYPEAAVQPFGHRRSNLGLPESNKSVLPLHYLAGKGLQTLSVRKAAI